VQAAAEPGVPVPRVELRISVAGIGDGAEELVESLRAAAVGHGVAEAAEAVRHPTASMTTPAAIVADARSRARAFPSFSRKVPIAEPKTMLSSRAGATYETGVKASADRTST